MSHRDWSPMIHTNRLSKRQIHNYKRDKLKIQQFVTVDSWLKYVLVALFSAARAVFFRARCEFLQLFKTPHLPEM